MCEILKWGRIETLPQYSVLACLSLIHWKISRVYLPCIKAQQHLLNPWNIFISLTGWAPVHSFFDRFINFFRGDQGYGFELYSTASVGQ